MLGRVELKLEEEIEILRQKKLKLLKRKSQLLKQKCKSNEPFAAGTRERRLRGFRYTKFDNDDYYVTELSVSDNQAGIEIVDATLDYEYGLTLMSANSEN